MKWNNIGTWNYIMKHMWKTLPGCKTCQHTHILSYILYNLIQFRFIVLSSVFIWTSYFIWFDFDGVTSKKWHFSEKDLFHIVKMTLFRKWPFSMVRHERITFWKKGKHWGGHTFNLEVALSTKMTKHSHTSWFWAFLQKTLFVFIIFVDRIWNSLQFKHSVRKSVN